MKKLALFLLVVFTLSGCTAPQTGAPVDSLKDPENFTLIPSSDITLALDAPVLEQNSGPLTARIFSSQDATVNDGSYLIQGTANQEVVVTVNDNIFTSPPESIFSLTVDLEEGPNLIEIVISDLEGNEVNFTLTITYET